MAKRPWLKWSFWLGCGMICRGVKYRISQIINSLVMSKVYTNGLDWITSIEVIGLLCPCSFPRWALPNRFCGPQTLAKISKPVEINRLPKSFKYLKWRTPVTCLREKRLIASPFFKSYKTMLLSSEHVAMQKGLSISMQSVIKSECSYTGSPTSCCCAIGLIFHCWILKSLPAVSQALC